MWCKIVLPFLFSFSVSLSSISMSLSSRAHFSSALFVIFVWTKPGMPGGVPYIQSLRNQCHTKGQTCSTFYIWHMWNCITKFVTSNIYWYSKIMSLLKEWASYQCLLYQTIWSHYQIFLACILFSIYNNYKLNHKTGQNWILFQLTGDQGFCYVASINFLNTVSSLLHWSNDIIVVDVVAHVHCHFGIYTSADMTSNCP